MTRPEYDPETQLEGGTTLGAMNAWIASLYEPAQSLTPKPEAAARQLTFDLEHEDA